MAAARIGYRGNAIGISAGLGIALPLAAYAATISVDGVNDIVRMDAMPFAAGALAGVGMLAVTGHLLDVHANRVAAERAEAERYASLYGHATSSAPHDARVRGAAGGQGHEAASRDRDRESGAASVSPAQTFIGKRFARREQPNGVPVISRAVDALDEMEAWAEIDAMFSDDSPFSCDPARSKDMYQIALEELRRSEAAQAQRTSSSAADTHAWGTPAAPAATYTSRPMTQVVAPTADEAEADQARSDALASLYGRVTAQRSYAPAMPTMASPSTAAYAAVSHGLGASAQAPSMGTPATPVAAASPAASAAAQPGSQVGAQPGTAASASPHAGSAVAFGSQMATTDDMVPMADYTGHESMWSAALAILAEEEQAASAEAHLGASSHAHREVPTGEVDARRMAAVAEGGNATRMHSHVNSLIEEEFDKVPSRSVHSTAHEYLKVIEGGTAAMPSLQTAEA